jgi:hypothetical protein
MSDRETADNYPQVVAVLNAGWRVIRCRDGLQWVLQRRSSPETSRGDDWRARSYCQTKEALIRCSREYAGEMDPAACTTLAALPERITAEKLQQEEGAAPCVTR